MNPEELLSGLLDFVSSRGTRLELPHPAIAPDQMDAFLARLANSMAEETTGLLRHIWPDEPVGTTGADASVATALAHGLTAAVKPGIAAYGSFEAVLRLSAGIPLTAVLSIDELEKRILAALRDSLETLRIPVDDGPGNVPNPTSRPPDDQDDRAWPDPRTDDPVTSKLLTSHSPSPCSRMIQNAPIGVPSSGGIGHQVHQSIQQLYRDIYSSPDSPQPNLVCLERMAVRGSETWSMLDNPPAGPVTYLDTAVKYAKRTKGNRKPPDTDSDVRYKRPDIADLTSAEFYEIKPERGAADGERQLYGVYVNPFNQFVIDENPDPSVKRVRAGTSFGAFHFGAVRSKAMPYVWVSHRPCDGIIIYRLFSPESLEEEVLKLIVAWRDRRRTDEHDVQGLGSRIVNGHNPNPGPASNDDSPGPSEGEREAAKVIAAMLITIAAAYVCAVGAGLVLVTVLFGLDAVLVLAAAVTEAIGLLGGVLTPILIEMAEIIFARIPAVAH